MTQTVVVEGLTKAYGSLVAVNDLSLQVAKGELFGILGPNGAGKTTTLEILATLTAPDAGTARVAGRDVSTEPDAVRRRLGLLFQGPSLDLQLTARENLRFHARLYGLPAGVIAERIAGSLALVELADRADEPTERLSGGMRRRLELARALLHEPDVLILDEPTVGLDPHARSRIWDHLRHLRRERSVTILLSTHDMAEAEHCQRLAILHQGELVACRAPDAFKAEVGGDVVQIESETPAALARTIEERFSLRPQLIDGRIRLEHPAGHRFVPRLIEACPGRVQAVSVQQPSLGDAFLRLTGYALQDGEALAVETVDDGSSPEPSRQGSSPAPGGDA